MVLYDFLRKLVGVYQHITILDFTREAEAGAQTLYSGANWKCPYSEEPHQHDPISQMKVDLVEAVDDTLVISLGMLVE